MKSTLLNKKTILNKSKIKDLASGSGSVSARKSRFSQSARASELKSSSVYNTLQFSDMIQNPGLFDTNAITDSQKLKELSFQIELLLFDEFLSLEVNVTSQNLYFKLIWLLKHKFIISEVL